MAETPKAGTQKSVAIVAPACRLAPETANKVSAIAAAKYGDGVRLYFHPQCFLSAGHFAGEDAERAAAFVEAANDPAFDAVWFARGGYGACRLGDHVFQQLGPAAKRKTYLGYSDIGFLLARLYRDGVGSPAHGPMPSDINRPGGEAAVARSLDWLVNADAGGVEPSTADDAPVFAFNLTVLSALLGTRAEPDFTDSVLLLEDVDEHHYQIDRALFHVTSNAGVRRVAGLKMGRFSLIPENDPPFNKSVAEIFEYWCAKSGMANLGAADIGHDSENKIVPFGPPNSDGAA
ncbi:MAG: LD-carboxypeptidase [Parvularculaceae bacterium]